MNNELHDLQREVQRLRAQIKAQRYGLVWLDVPEAFDSESDNRLPILKASPDLDISEAMEQRSNLLIEGDNYHSLTCLSYTHKNKIDVIYIDPPYNTGSDGFRYKDKRVLDQHPDGELIDKNHPLRHSAWLSFMEKRLRLAKELLTQDGVIFISIDDHEYAQLKLLCDDIFVGTSGNNLIGTLVWQRAKGGGNSKKFVRGHEYILCYSMSSNLTLTQAGDKAVNHVKKSQTAKGKDKYVTKDGVLYFINDDVIRRVFGKYEAGTERRCEYENLLAYKSQKVKDEVDAKIASGEYILQKQPDGLHYICALEPVADMRQVMYSIIQGFLSEVGNEDLKKLGLEGAFEFPKPVGLIKILLDSVGKKSGIFLDFFAGSGTTGQAVIELNKVDGGQRQFILCTNNENNIATEVTRKRLERVIGGFGDYAPNPSSLKYLKTAFVGKNNILQASDDDRIELAREATSMLSIAENTLNLLESNDYFVIYKDEIAEKYTAVYFREELARFDDFSAAVKSLNGEISVYIFSWGNETDYADEITRQSVTIKTIPQQILEIYRQIYSLGGN